MQHAHTMKDNLLFLFRKSFSFDKSLFVSVIARIPVNILIPLITSYLTKYMTSITLGQTDSGRFLAYVLSCSVMILALTLVNNYTAAKIKYDTMFVRLRYLGSISDKNMEADYQNVEAPSGQLLAQKAKSAVYSSSSGAEQMFDQLVGIFSSVFGLITYSVLVFRVIPWGILLLSAAGVADFFVGLRFSKWQRDNRDQWAEYDRRLNYLNNKAGDYRAAKDVRLFGLGSWLETLYGDYFRSRVYWYRREENHRLVIQWEGLLLAFVRDGLIYGMLIYQLFARQMEVSDFIFYFTIITQYSVWVFGLMNNFVALKTSSYTAEEIRRFLEMPDCFRHGEGAPVPEEETCQIIFDHVGFRYADAGQDTLEDLDFTIRKGEKVAIVGVNGAGKTTLVKLLCGLYAPTRGRILVGGRDIREYDINDYYALYSVVFQDIYLMPTTIARNIALTEEERIDKDNLRRAIALSGLETKIADLPRKEDTLLMKGIQEKGIDLSGGEKQKLALARALYKDGRMLVLDEPTAALDPIAESEVYQKYSEMTSGRTAVFISHRLASTRFCDTILVLEGGRIVEKGTHDQLMELGGKYADMFRIQSQYYREGAQDEQ